MRKTECWLSESTRQVELMRAFVTRLRGAPAIVRNTPVSAAGSGTVSACNSVRAGAPKERRSGEHCIANGRRNLFVPIASTSETKNGLPLVRRWSSTRPSRTPQRALQPRRLRAALFRTFDASGRGELAKLRHRRRAPRSASVCCPSPTSGRFRTGQRECSPCLPDRGAGRRLSCSGRWRTALM